jgi:hypothetical protein
VIFQNPGVMRQCVEEVPGKRLLCGRLTSSVD